MRMKFKVENVKSGGQWGVAVGDLALGFEEDGQFVGILKVFGIWLKEKRDKTGLYVQFPSKLRVKGGVAQTDAKGNKIYDSIVDLYLGENGPTDQAFEFRKWLIAEMQTAVSAVSAGESGRGVAAQSPGGPAKPKATKPPKVAVESGGDDLPF